MVNIRERAGRRKQEPVRSPDFFSRRANPQIPCRKPRHLLQCQTVPANRGGSKHEATTNRRCDTVARLASVRPARARKLT